jgi:hypothetical protein
MGPQKSGAKAAALQKHWPAEGLKIEGGDKWCCKTLAGRWKLKIRAVKNAALRTTGRPMGNENLWGCNCSTAKAQAG